MHSQRAAPRRGSRYLYILFFARVWPNEVEYLFYKVYLLTWKKEYILPKSKLCINMRLKLFYLPGSNKFMGFMMLILHVTFLL